MKTLLYNGNIINENTIRVGSIVVENDCVADIMYGDTTPRDDYDNIIDATGRFILPGVIDSHVHFRDPGLTRKADFHSETRAAAAGGVTSCLDMPNTVPQTTTTKAWEEKRILAQEKSIVNFGMFFGATNDNVDTLTALDTHRVPGIKLFMGSSTGNMLVDRREALSKLFANARLPIMAHCEDTDTINRNMKEAKAKWGDDPKVELHPLIRSEEACLKSTSLAVSLAQETGARLHVAHLTTARELELFGNDPNITAEATVAHLMFCDEQYATLGTRIKCNPAVKTRGDRDALRRALNDGRIYTIGTDHAPHLPEDKAGGCAKAASGMPMVQFSLVCMLELTDKGVLSKERMVELMCHNPARLFDITRRGFIRKGYKADIAIVANDKPWTVTTDCIESKCGWSPLEGHVFDWRVVMTMCNGKIVMKDGLIDDSCRGEALTFRG